ncbi:MarR family transcriptional regulator [Schlegelella sp. S2-27]|uniref:MarR family transcriptional regulator n=1 Tax=Caldimonas mangrovi TaxID=2944811 RepID=A0ABT0YVE4_9BURK|nr:MarR family transcriptional regulator [Caldimonas mangrovi]MCM5682722.1 MarR family transcriptional regulator [Caldimonas mangrovi]
MRKSVDNVNGKVAADPGTLLDAVQAVAHLVRSRQLQALRGGQEGLTPLETRVLFYFAHHPGSSLRELTEHSGRDKGQLGRLVGGLREHGWLRAESDEVDRRVTRFFLTDEALKQQQSMLKQRRLLADAAVQGLSAAERQQLAALLEQVRANLEKVG